MLDGAARLPDLMTEAVRLGMPALAITDHGNVFGAYDFWKAARAAGINPIIGMEGYVAPGSRHERTRATLDGTTVDDSNPGEMYTHMTLLAETTEGMGNLFRLSSLASLEGFYYKPRMDRELLETYSKGIIATTGCPSGEVNRLLQRGDYKAACQAASDYRDIFGAENYYCELMDHGIDVERGVKRDLMRLAHDLNLPLLATNDLHYVRAQDAKPHDALLCVQTKKTIADQNRFRFEGQEFYLKSAEQMRALFDDGDFPGACDNTLAIAARCHVEFDEGADLMPRFPVPDGETEASWLLKEVNLGLARRLPRDVPAEYRARLDAELDLILRMGYSGYFLVTADLIRHAKSIGIRVGPGRGSVVGSLVAYALGITELDPIVHRLLFERFLNPERPSTPDIDLDFDERRRGEVIDYVTGKYGADRVAQIVTYSTIKARAAVKDAAKVLHGAAGFALADRISKAMPPPIMGKDIPLTGIFDPDHKRYGESAAVRALYDNDAQVKEVIDTARGLEGLKRQWGVHAAGVIVSRLPLLDVVPIHRRPADGAIITQFDMWACEALGLVKMDFLGLRNLTIIDDCLAGIAASGKPVPLLETLPLDDPGVYQLLARGDTLGVFQLDSGPIRDLLRKMGPTHFGDISACNALYRPGPMAANAHNDYADRKNHRQPVKPIHPELAEPLADILDETYGLIVYQEQVLAIAQRVAGYSLGRADLLRKAMGKKIRAVLDREYGPFADGMAASGYSPGAVKALWDILIPFSDYAFNRAHTAAYGLIGYWTAYLKVHHPVEYMAALLTSVGDDKDRSAIYLAECRHMGITVLVPDVNASGAHFTADGVDIRFGLSAVRNVGAGAVEAIIAGRVDGPYTSIADFLRRVPASACNKGAVESLIKAGAFDSLGYARCGLHGACAAVIAAARPKGKRAGQGDLFAEGAFDVDIPTAQWDTPVQLAHERDMLGLYVSAHPLDSVAPMLATQGGTPITAILDGTVPGGGEAVVTGMLTDVKRGVTRGKGEPWAKARLEDLAAGIEVLFFPKTYAVVGEHVTDDAIVVLKVKVSTKDDRIALFVTDLIVPELPTSSAVPPLELGIAAGDCTPKLLAQLTTALAANPGNSEVWLRLAGPGGVHRLRLPGGLRVDPSVARNIGHLPVSIG
jgi:DNA polymerase-3 subunit alpha